MPRIHTIHLTPSACFVGDDLFALLYIIIIITIKPCVKIALVFYSIFYTPLVNRCSSSVFQSIECLCVTVRRSHYNITFIICVYSSYIKVLFKWMI